MNTTQNPYNYMSKDWSRDIEGYKRMMSNAVVNIVHDVLNGINPPIEPGDESSDKVRLLYHTMTHRPVNW